MARDSRYDGEFVYAVRSTGIYCRPSCPSRRPRRPQVLFFAAPATAEQAGFRACRRCRPDAPAVPDARVATVRAACGVLDAQPAEPWTLVRLARRVGTAPHRLQRAFRAVLGVSPRQYRAARRLQRFKTSLRKEKTVSPALYEAGYGSPSRVYETAATHLGMTPATYGRGGLGALIRYAIVTCPLGWLLVAATDRGICHISLGDSAPKVERAFRSEFPAAELVHDDAALRDWVTRLTAHLDGRERQLDLPLDVRATAFQLRVWKALQAIPYGTTRSYADIARAIGAPRATRAVARACATNPVALLIPCHRVVRQDGAPGGYRWDPKRKRALLEQEHRG